MTPMHEFTTIRNGQPVRVRVFAPVNPPDDDAPDTCKHDPNGRTRGRGYHGSRRVPDYGTCEEQFTRHCK